MHTVSARQLIDEPVAAVIPTALFSFNKMLILFDASQAPNLHSSSSGKTIFDYQILKCVCNLAGWLGVIPPLMNGIYCVDVEGVAEEPDLAKKLSMLARKTLYSESPLLDAKMDRRPVLSSSDVLMHTPSGDSWKLFHTDHPYMAPAATAKHTLLPASRIPDALAAYHETLLYDIEDYIQRITPEEIRADALRGNFDQFGELFFCGCRQLPKTYRESEVDCLSAAPASFYHDLIFPMLPVVDLSPYEEKILDQCDQLSEFISEMELCYKFWRALFSTSSGCYESSLTRLRYDQLMRAREAGASAYLSAALDRKIPVEDLFAPGLVLGEMDARTH